MWNLGDGKSDFFWIDLYHDTCLFVQFPHVFTFAKNVHLTMDTVLQQNYLKDLFHLPLTYQSHEEFLQMEGLHAQLQVSKHKNSLDTWSYIGGNSNFSIVKAYNVLIGSGPTPPHFKWVCGSSCQSKHKVFFWLLLQDRLNTRNLLFTNVSCRVIIVQQCHIMRGCLLSVQFFIIGWRAAYNGRKKKANIILNVILFFTGRFASSCLSNVLTFVFLDINHI